MAKKQEARLESEQQSLKAAARRASKAGASASDHDPQRRLGTFVGAGEASRKGSRTSGIGGQKKQKTRTDKKG
jgi:hypothetical protein